jgi:hypothetical protein
MEAKKKKKENTRNDDITTTKTVEYIIGKIAFEKTTRVEYHWKHLRSIVDSKK